MIQPVISIVSGGFDPLTIGHIRLFKEAKEYGDELLVILNNDNWLMAKKGYTFMPQEERKEILESIKYVNNVVLTKHEQSPTDMSVCDTLEELALYYIDYLKFKLRFCNGGDRGESNIPEYFLCKKLGIELVFGVGGEKIQSSSWLVEKVRKQSETTTGE